LIFIDEAEMLHIVGDFSRDESNVAAR